MTVYTATAANSKSIHPFGRKGTNVSRQKRQSTIDRAMRGLEGHLTRHPGDGVSTAHLAALQKLTGI